MAACAENLTPVVIEAGGKDSLIVDEDADLAKAAEAALWGGMSNAGQTCIGTERVYVHENVFDAFIDRDPRPGDRGCAPVPTPGAKIGPITMPSQLGVIRSHLDDAVARGARVALGGPDAVGEQVRPADDPAPTCPRTPPRSPRRRSARRWPINPVASMDEAVRLTNATEYGLGRCGLLPVPTACRSRAGSARA